MVSSPHCLGIGLAYTPWERPFFLIIPAHRRPYLVVPLLELAHARERVILDLDNKVPERMEKLIGSSWGNYRVVHIAEDEDLRSALVLSPIGRSS